MKNRLMKFMQGRYGADQFGNFLILAAVAVLFLGMLCDSPTIRSLFAVMAALTVFYAYFRILSRNCQKRYSENMRYLKCVNSIKLFFTRKISHMKQRRTHHIYKCPQCGQSIRVPKGKGRIAITCPKCQNEFIKKS